MTPGPSHASSAFTPVSRSAIRRTLLKRARPRPAVGRLGNLACHDNRLDTSDNIRIAVGRICLAYTLRDEDLREDGASNEGNLSHCSDPGLAAFRQLEWMVSAMQNEHIPHDSREHIRSLLQALLNRAQQGNLPPCRRILVSSRSNRVSSQYSDTRPAS